jgi:hypothetical protein
MLAHPQTFPCPNCNEIINDSMQTCRFCSAAVDPQVAATAAELQAKVNQACSDASYVRIAAVVMFVFLGLSFVPFLPTYWGFLVTFLVVMIMLIRWQVKSGGLQTRDPDYLRAKRLKNIALVLWLVAIPAGFIVRPLIGVIVSAILS